MSQETIQLIAMLVFFAILGIGLLVYLYKSDRE